MNRTLVSLILVLLISFGPVLAQTESSGNVRSQSPVEAGLSNINLQTPQEPAVELHLLVGKSLVLNSPQILKRISIADPTIASAVTVSPSTRDPPRSLPSAPPNSPAPVDRLSRNAPPPSATARWLARCAG